MMMMMMMEKDRFLGLPANVRLYNSSNSSSLSSNCRLEGVLLLFVKVDLSSAFAIARSSTTTVVFSYGSKHRETEEW